MKKYRQRMAWYLAVLMINLGILLTTSELLTSASFPALLYYLPSSIFWLFAGPWLFGSRLRSNSVFGIKAERFGFLIIGIGAFGTVFLLLQGNAKLASIAICAAMCGVEFVISSREDRYSADQPESSLN
ncbi:hypothetical protein [Pandoraea pulmonicola]|uniref:Uncharacterized protein n=1 Tax=Pandoraea pulmonicola TaxID=93221 RepID=A0AAJ4ZAF4_PANPU|nr:hypothetical protein [Pandoraea pulmonicola]AJC21528.1 hypothetical protein RO07_15400 [Pandoraea pulmonicola]SUA89681.1 Uncharacterised protein [Pandoraea pulmonicola]